MSLMNLEKAAKKYESEPMKGNIARLIDFDRYHCLLAGKMTAALELQRRYPCFPSAFLEWLQLCDGGLLFDTVMLSSKGHDAALDLDFDTYEDFNSDRARAELGLPDGYVVFALRSYGDVLCFHAEKDDGKVYLWDVEEGAFSESWDTFADWITEEIDTGVRLIADEVLDPLSIKAGDADDE
ncbi:MAG: SMI1/KNR4 family protein [Oscillospiraceae bacterium]|nr:SMI1/KNR4 family protein [Oscillospiraceae bacterium]